MKTQVDQTELLAKPLTPEQKLDRADKYLKKLNDQRNEAKDAAREASGGRFNLTDSDPFRTF